MKRLAYYLALPFLYGISLLPFPLFYLLSDLFCFLLYYVVGYRRKVVMENLRNAFPEKSEEERKRIARQYYQNLADIMLETIKMLTISKKSLRERFHLTNPEVAAKYLDQGRSIVGAVGHFGNWEWACLVQGMGVRYPSIVIYKTLKNPWFNKLFLKMRSRTGAILVPMRQTLRALVAYRNKPFMSILAADQTPRQQSAIYWTRFLNQDTAAYLGIEKVAKMNNSVVVYCDIQRVGRGRYRVSYRVLFENPKETADFEITEGYLGILEKRIRENPADWLWSHRRWKVKKPVPSDES